MKTQFLTKKIFHKIALIGLVFGATYAGTAVAEIVIKNGVIYSCTIDPLGPNGMSCKKIGTILPSEPN